MSNQQHETLVPGGGSGPSARDPRGRSAAPDAPKAPNVERGTQKAPAPSWEGGPGRCRGYDPGPVGRGRSWLAALLAGGVILTSTTLAQQPPTLAPPAPFNPYAPYAAPVSQARPGVQIPAGTPDPAPSLYPSVPGQAIRPPAWPTSLDFRRRQPQGPPYPPPAFLVPPPGQPPMVAGSPGWPGPSVTPLAPAVAPQPVQTIPPPAVPAYPEMLPGGPTPQMPSPVPTQPQVPPPLPAPPPMPAPAVQPHGIPSLPPPAFPTYVPAPTPDRRSDLVQPPPMQVAPPAAAVVPQPAAGPIPSMMPPPGTYQIPAPSFPAATVVPPPIKPKPAPPPPDIQKGPVTEVWQAEEIRNLIRGIMALRDLPEKAHNPIALRKVIDIGRRSTHLLNFPGWPVLPTFDPRSDDNVIRNRSYGAWEYRHYGSFQTRLNGWIKPAGEYLNFDFDFNGRGFLTVRMIGSISRKGALRGRVEALGIRRDGYHLRVVLDFDGVFVRDDGYPAGGKMTVSGVNIGGLAATFPLHFPIDIRRMPRVVKERRVSDWSALGDTP